MNLRNQLVSYPEAFGEVLAGEGMRYQKWPKFRAKYDLKSVSPLIGILTPRERNKWGFMNINEIYQNAICYFPFRASIGVGNIPSSPHNPPPPATRPCSYQLRTFNISWVDIFRRVSNQGKDWPDPVQTFPHEKLIRIWEKQILLGFRSLNYVLPLLNLSFCTSSSSSVAI